MRRRADGGRTCGDVVMRWEEGANEEVEEVEEEEEEDDDD
eukprot:CAMPEP_0114376948 /NCGR_PEP_ID=MMETSP0102-20121206/694_1 /TAXON_ID=38822 ORGANISM="Pteridomonas danica, Strain PT" /NCGR_SAMPLE_ID=MMETSP0102 /ASSEMBLY_ACC=CAM_ASM_000212 /LENGTH=39 /DNA_ID= /DNA_START= /DNA_END= /DNA_ORIENTATION=